MKSTVGIGNKCGHQPDSPRYFSAPENHANRPIFIKAFQNKFQNFYVNPALLRGLNNPSESNRQKRTERREACVAIMGSLGHYVDLVTYRVGIPQADGSMMGLTMPYLAKLANLSLRRAERAVHDLKKAGYITVHPICIKLADAKYKGIAAIRTISRELFTALGMDAWLKHEQRKAKERKIQREEKKRRKGLAHVHMAMKAAKPKAAAIAPVKRTGAMTSIADHFANIRSILEPDPLPD